MARKHSKDHASGPTHAIEELNEAGVPFVVHEYEHDPSARAYGEETVEKLGIDPAIAFKTLMVKLEPTGEFVVGCVPALAHLSMKLIAKAAGAKMPRWPTLPLRSAVRAMSLAGLVLWGRRQNIESSLIPHVWIMKRCWYREAAGE